MRFASPIPRAWHEGWRRLAWLPNESAQPVAVPRVAATMCRREIARVKWITALGQVDEYAEQWRAAQVHRPSSAAHVETMLRRHAYPAFGDRPIGTIRPGEIQAWVKGSPLAPATVHVLHGVVSAILRAAVRDRIIPSSPCETTKLPRKIRCEVVPLTVEAVTALGSAVPPRYRALVVLCAGTGLRQGEAFGLTQDRVNFLKRCLTVDRQLIGQEGPTAVWTAQNGCQRAHSAPARRGG
jgi:integrase